jgi:hypothetical protein
MINGAFPRNHGGASGRTWGKVARRTSANRSTIGPSRSVRDPGTMPALALGRRHGSAFDRLSAAPGRASIS